jgi:hypothetical protein
VRAAAVDIVAGKKDVWGRWGGGAVCLVAGGQKAEHHDGLGGREGQHEHGHPMFRCVCVCVSVCARVCMCLLVCVRVRTCLRARGVRVWQTLMAAMPGQQLVCVMDGCT